MQHISKLQPNKPLRDMTKAEREEYWTLLASDMLSGQTIGGFDWFTQDEADGTFLSCRSRPLIIILENEMQMVVMRDDEGNGPGVLFILPSPDTFGVTLDSEGNGEPMLIRGFGELSGLSERDAELIALQQQREETLDAMLGQLTITGVHWATREELEEVSCIQESRPLVIELENGIRLIPMSTNQFDAGSGLFRPGAFHCHLDGCFDILPELPQIEIPAKV